MGEFLYLYRGGVHPESPAAMQANMQRWMTWLEGLAKQGHVKDKGQPLDAGGSVVSGKQRSVTDGPYAEKDVVGGFTLELSRGCPIFDGGGVVEVRPVMQM